MPPDPVHQDILDALDNAVSYCIHPTNGTRPMPDGFLKTAHYRSSPKWTQITGTYDPSVMHLSPDDCGSEYDSLAPKGVKLEDGRYFFSFLGGCDGSGRGTFCMRICDSYEYCSSAYDQLGCEYVAPGDYAKPNAFTECQADAGDPVMVYHGTSTFYQGMKPTPAPHAPPKSSLCTTWASPTPSGVTYSWNQQSTAAAATPSSSTVPTRPATLAFPSAGASDAASPTPVPTGSSSASSSSSSWYSSYSSCSSCSSSLAPTASPLRPSRQEQTSGARSSHRRIAAAAALAALLCGRLLLL
ncbi:hypothetical protein ACQY0O_001712 [Thecaphora frezii]